MTTLTRSKLTFYFACRDNPEHRFERASDTMKVCPKCDGVVRLYGLKDSSIPEFTEYEQASVEEDSPTS